MLAMQAQNAHRSSQATHEPEYPRSILEFMTIAAFAVSRADLRAPQRGPAPVALARQCAMYLAHVGFGLNFTEVGRLFNRDRTTAAYACRVIEERRDDPAIDILLGVLEQACCPPQDTPADVGGRA
jgi:chromosomal replication initiation ATPase DnaA